MGVDPGSRFTGWGIIESDGSESRYVASGCIVLPPRRPMGQRLTQIYRELGETAHRHRVEEAALETVFMHKNVQSALKLGQARGAALCALVMAGIGEAAEYSPGASSRPCAATEAPARRRWPRWWRSCWIATAIWERTKPTDLRSAFAMRTI